jgi:hypothetical protein
MALPKYPLLYVSEKDIDLLLLEELTVSRPFGLWFARQGGLEVSGWAELLGAWHSVSDSTLGESDLLAVWREPGGDRVALLIEDKIDACAQPEQGARYRLRGQQGIDEGDWDSFETCMVAPARYLDSSTDAREYGATISYEDVREFLGMDPHADERARYRASVLLSAIEQQRRGYSPEIDEYVSRFWISFWQASLDRCPRLAMSEPGPKPAGAGWIWVRPPELGRRRSIGFKLLLGIVDLQIDGAVDQAERIDRICVDTLRGEVRAFRTGKSASLRVEVDPVDVTQDFESQLASVESAFDGANRLLEAWKEIEGEIPVE